MKGWRVGIIHSQSNVPILDSISITGSSVFETRAPSDEKRFCQLSSAKYPCDLKWLRNVDVYELILHEKLHVVHTFSALLFLNPVPT